jgi:hypothetical protein
LTTIYFASTYKPIMCGIADYTSFITRELPAGKWGVISFDLENYGVALKTDEEFITERVWYGIPGRHNFSAAVIQQGLQELRSDNKDSILWFQHEFGIWPDSDGFVAMLQNLDIRKIVTFHTLHFQSSETPTGLRQVQYNLLQKLLPYVDAITVFSRGVHHAVTSAFPEHYDKVHIIKHGIHSYPDIRHLSRKEAKEKLNDYLFYESDLDQKTKEILHRKRIFLSSHIIVLGQTGFLAPSKGSETLYSMRDHLQKLIPQQRIVALRIGTSRDESQKIYADKLRREQLDENGLLLEVWLPGRILPLAQRAFDINIYWPINCTQSGILAHALGAAAVIAGRDLEGVGEVLKDAGEIVDKDLEQLVMNIKNATINPQYQERIEDNTLQYAQEYSWAKQARRHYSLADSIIHNNRPSTEFDWDDSDSLRK